VKNIFFVPLIFMISVVLSAQTISAQQNKRLYASVQRNNVIIGEPVILTITAMGIQPPAPPVLPPMDAFEVNFQGQSVRVEIINFERTQSISYQYELIPKRAGMFQIPPVTVVEGGYTFRTNPISVRVSQTSTAVQGDSTDVALEVTLSSTKCYLEQPVVLELKRYLKSDISGYSLNIPFLPTFKNFLIKNIEPDPSQNNYEKVQYNNQVIEYFEKTTELYNGQNYITLTLRKILIPASSGTFTIDPVTLRCDVVKGYRKSRDPFDDFGFGGFFSSSSPVVERRAVSSKPVTLVVEPLPPAPSGFSQNISVGDFSMTVAANPKEVKTGDPITLTILVKGTGNIEGLNEPILTTDKDFRVFHEDAKTDIKITSDGISGEKVFQTLLIPTSDRVQFIPPLKLDFFNPATNQFRSITSEQIPVKVIPKPVSEEPVVVGAASEEPSGQNIQIIYRDLPGTIKVTPGTIIIDNGYYVNSIWYKAIFVFALVFNILFGFYMRRERMLKSDTVLRRKTFAYKFSSKYVRQAESSLRKNNITDFYTNLVKALNEYVADKLNIPSAGLTEETVKANLQTKGVDVDIIERIINFYRKADMARFMPSKQNIDSAKDINEVKEIISLLEKRKW